MLVYSVYTGKRDTATRLKRMLEMTGFKVAVLRSSVGTDKREDWIILNKSVGSRLLAQALDSTALQ